MSIFDLPPGFATYIYTVETTAFVHCTVEYQASHEAALSISFDSSSFPIRPRLRIDPAFGAFSLGCAASAFR